MTGAGALRRRPNDDDCGLAKSIAGCLENESVHPQVVPQCSRVQVEVERPANRLQKGPAQLQQTAAGPVTSPGWAPCIAGEGARVASRPPLLPSRPAPPRRPQDEAIWSLCHGTPPSQHPLRNPLAFCCGAPSVFFKVLRWNCFWCEGGHLRLSNPPALRIYRSTPLRLIERFHFKK